MTVTQIDLDDETLAAAMRLMGVTTKKETVNRALREYVQRVERLRAAEALAERGARGECLGRPEAFHPLHVLAQARLTVSFLVVTPMRRMAAASVSSSRSICVTVTAASHVGYVHEEDTSPT